MNEINPYAAPTSIEADHEGASPHDVRGLTSLRRAVRWAGAAMVLITMGYLFAVFTGIVQYANFPEEILGRGSMFVMLIFRSIQYVLVALAAGYNSLMIWRYSGVLSAAIRQEPVSAATILVAQRRCWYAAAGVALLYILMSLASPFVMMWAYR